MESLADGGRLLAQRDGKRRHQLVERPLGRPGKPRVTEDLRLRHQESAELRLVEPGHPRAPAFRELPATARAAQRENRHAGGAERLHVPMHRAQGHLEPLRQRASRQAAVGLQKQQGGQQALGFHRNLAACIFGQQL